jgi:hypothetical protein
MAQGAIKMKAKVAAKPQKSAALGPKKGLRAIAPKKTVLVKNQKMMKVCYAFCSLSTLSLSIPSQPLLSFYSKACKLTVMAH